MKTVAVELVRSLNKCTERQVETANTLKLRKIHDVSILPHDKAVCGKIWKLGRLVKVVDKIV